MVVCVSDTCCCSIRDTRVAICCCSLCDVGAVTQVAAQGGKAGVRDLGLLLHEGLTHKLMRKSTVVASTRRASAAGLSHAVCACNTGCSDVEALCVVV